MNKDPNNQQAIPEDQLQEDVAEEESRMMDEGGGVVTSGVTPEETVFRQGPVISQGDK